MNWLKDLYNKYKYLKLFHKLPEAARVRGFWPSETYNKYPATHTFNGLKVLNVGCGTNIYPHSNVINLDGYEGEGVNVVWDLSKTPLPFKDQEFNFIIANHVLEHIPNWFECFKELARVLKVGGKMEVWIPPVSSDSAFVYRDHINYIGTESFTGCTNFVSRTNNLWANENRKNLGNVKNLTIIKAMHRTIVRWWMIFAPQAMVQWCQSHLRNVVSESGFFFTKVSHD